MFATRRHCVPLHLAFWKGVVSNSLKKTWVLCFSQDLESESESESSMIAHTRNLHTHVNLVTGGVVLTSSYLPTLPCLPHTGCSDSHTLMSISSFDNITMVFGVPYHRH